MIIERECYQDKCQFCKDGLCDYNCFTIIDEGQFLDECLLHIDVRNTMKDAMDMPTDWRRAELANEMYELWENRIPKEHKEKIDIDYYESIYE